MTDFYSVGLGFGLGLVAGAAFLTLAGKWPFATEPELRECKSCGRFVKLGLKIGLLIFLLAFSWWLNTIQHEEGHRAIFLKYDCNATIAYEFPNGAKTISSCPTMPEADRKFLVALQAQHEVVGYQLYTISQLVCLAIWLLIILNWEKYQGRASG